MRKGIFGLIFCLLFLCLSGCRDGGGIAQENTSGIVDKSVVDTAYKVYYLNNDNIHIEGVSAIYTSETAMELMEECLESLKADPEDENLKATIPEDVEVLDQVYDEVTKQVDLYFNSAYRNIPKNQEILVRAAIVKTLTQFDGVIDYVQFFIDGTAMTESDGQPMIMMQSDFVDNTRADVKRLNQETIRLYFASSDGTKLVAEDIYVHYSKNVSLERVIVESLISGPISENLNPTMSSDVKLYDDVSVTDGTCSVDFNQRFLDRIKDQSFAINVYSVVNSLTELDYIQQVQIKIVGKIVEGNDETISLAQPLSRNEDLIVRPSDTPPVVESSTGGAEQTEVTADTAVPEQTEMSDMAESDTAQTESEAAEQTQVPDSVSETVNDSAA